MSIQYSDTHFSENMPFDEALTRFQECLADGIPVQALHVGTFSELAARKKEITRRANLQAQVDELRERIDKIGEPLTSDSIVIPNRDEISKFSKEP